MAVANIDPNRIPKHVACVMDGNGRWARQRGLPRTEGHAAGEEAMFDTVEGALELGVELADDVRLLDGELAAAARRGPLSHALQRGDPHPPSRRPEHQGRAHPLRRPPGLARAAPPHPATWTSRWSSPPRTGG